MGEFAIKLVDVAFALYADKRSNESSDRWGSRGIWQKFAGNLTAIPGNQLADDQHRCRVQFQVRSTAILSLSQPIQIGSDPTD